MVGGALQTVAQMPLGIVRGIANAPIAVVRGSTRLGDQVGTRIRGDQVNAGRALGAIGDIGTGLLDASLLGLPSLGKKFITQAGKQSLKNALITGAKGGAAFGGSYGVLSGLKEGENNPILQQLGLAAQQGITGTVGGGVVGAGLAGITHVGSNLFQGRYNERLRAAVNQDSGKINKIYDLANNQYQRERKIGTQPQVGQRKLWGKKITGFEAAGTQRIQPEGDIAQFSVTQGNKVTVLTPLEVFTKIQRGEISIQDVKPFNAVATVEWKKIGQEGFARIGADPKIQISGKKLIPQGKQILINPILEKGQSLSSQGSIPRRVKERGFVTSVQETPKVSGSVKKLVKGGYIPKANTQLMGEAQALLNEGTSIDFKNTKNLDQKVSATIQHAINLDKAGNHDAAAALYNNLSEHGTELGRGVQAFSLLNKMSPEAIALSAAGKIKKYNLTATRKIPELTGDQQKMLSDAVTHIGTLKNGSREKNIAINELSNMVNDFIPSSLTDKFITAWKAGLLTSLRTHERNLLGNTIMGAAEIAKDPFATVADKLLSLKTGQRTQSSTLRGLGEFGSQETRQQVTDSLKLGYDLSQPISKFEVKRINWGKSPIEQVLRKYTNIVFRTLSVEDKPFYNVAYARSLYDQAGAISKNTGKSIDALVKNPTEQMLTTATTDATYATFHDKTKLSGLASALKRWAGEKWYTQLPAEVLAPFTGVPSSIVGKTFAYSPIGLIKGAVDAGKVLVGNVPELQRQASQEIGRGIIGSGLFGIGAYLMSKGLITGQPKDAKESQLWQLQGKQANSVFIGGKWRSINSVGPQNLVILAGAKYQEEMGKTDGSLSTYALGLGKDQLSQTFVQGISAPINALTDPQRYGKSYVGNTANSIIPNIVKDISKAFDPSQRETNTLAEYMKSSIPGVRNTLLPKRDVLGNVVPQEPTGMGAFFDVFNSKTPIDTAIVREFSRLAQGENDATPSKLTINQTILKQKVKLTFDQLNTLETGVGEVLRPKLETLITSPTYQQLDDEHKVKAIDALVGDTRKKYKNITGQQIVSGTPSSSIFTPIVSSGTTFDYVDDLGNYKTVDIGKITKMPDTTNLEKVQKEQAVWKIVNTLSQSGMPQIQQDQIIKTLGVSSKDAVYYSIASASDAEKYAYVLDTAGTLQGQKLYDQLIAWRTPLNGKMILSDAVISTMVDQGHITEDQGKVLKNIDYTLNGKLKKIKGKKPKKITIKVPTYKKFKLAIFKPIKIKNPKKLKFKAYKPKKLTVRG